MSTIIPPKPYAVLKQLIILKKKKVTPIKIVDLSAHMGRRVNNDITLLKRRGLIIHAKFGRYAHVSPRITEREFQAIDVGQDRHANQMHYRMHRKKKAAKKDQAAAYAGRTYEDVNPSVLAREEIGGAYVPGRTTNRTMTGNSYQQGDE